MSPGLRCLLPVWLCVVLCTACGGGDSRTAGVAAGEPLSAPVPASAVSPQGLPPAQEPETAHRATAIFASGCFWCTESDFDTVPGVLSTTSGYTGGRVANPTYEQVSAGGTGHVESVEVVFDPAVVTYTRLLDVYWHNVDPFVARGQFCDFGEQYRPVIFVRNDAQRAAADASKAALQRRFDRPIVVAIEPAGPFYPAEAYHQNFHVTSTVRYKYYRWGCGRDARLAEIWKQAKP